VAKGAKKGSKKSRKKVLKNVPKGIAHIQATFNNTIVTLTDVYGNVISWASAGRVVSRGPERALRLRPSRRLRLRETAGYQCILRLRCRVLPGVAVSAGEGCAALRGTRRFKRSKTRVAMSFFGGEAGFAWRYFLSSASSQSGVLSIIG